MRTFAVFILLMSVFAHANTEDKPKTEQLVTGKNEAICKSTFGQEMMSQQMTFSNQANAQDVRRIAERKIAAARKTFANTGSYCDAAQVLMNFEPESLSGQDGDAQFKEQ
ncbi:hypothetical protein BZG14_10800 [Salinivibrio sp. IB282]|nr:hypothetical protein BZG14_10800 [Salinivibrio sp. IB282]